MSSPACDLDDLPHILRAFRVDDLLVDDEVDDVLSRPSEDDFWTLHAIPAAISLPTWGCA
jgi:hypothetical protein